MKKGAVQSVLGTAIVWAIVLVYAFPVYMMITIALKTPREFAFNTYGLPQAPTFDNIKQAWIKMSMPIPIINSSILTIGSVALVVLLSALASYGIARSDNRFAKFMYLFFLFGMMVNFQLIMIPLYKLMTDLKISNTHMGVILVYAAMSMGFSVMIFTGFIRSIPRSLDEAAMIDGAGKVRIFFSIIFPLLKTAIASAVIFNAIGIWNDLLMPLLFIGKHPTIVTALYNFQGMKFSTQWTVIFGGALVSVLPIIVVFLFLQKYFIKGMTAAAIKG